MHTRMRQHQGWQTFGLRPTALDLSEAQKIEIQHTWAPATAPSTPENPLNVQKVIHKHLRSVRTPNLPDTIEEFWLTNAAPRITFI